MQVYVFNIFTTKLSILRKHTNTILQHYTNMYLFYNVEWVFKMDIFILNQVHYWLILLKETIKQKMSLSVYLKFA